MQTTIQHLPKDIINYMFESFFTPAETVPSSFVKCFHKVRYFRYIQRKCSKKDVAKDAVMKSMVNGGFKLVIWCINYLQCSVDYVYSMANQCQHEPLRMFLKNGREWANCVNSPINDYCASFPIHKNLPQRTIQDVETLGHAYMDYECWNGYTVLTYACQYMMHDMVEKLLKRGADVNLSDAHGWTPLLRAVENNNVTTVEILIQAGANIDKTNKHGWTPLMRACIKGNVFLVKLFLKHGANVFLQNCGGQKAKDVAKKEEIKHMLDARCVYLRELHTYALRYPRKRSYNISVSTGTHCIRYTRTTCTWSSPYHILCTGTSNLHIYPITQ